jgi:hypothetical protein
MPFATPVDTLAVVRHGDDRWATVDPIVYDGQTERWMIEPGYVTDFASVPPIVVWLIPRFGRYTPAAILHDYLITDVLPAGMITPNDVDGLFRRVMRELGVSTPRRWLMWAGVRYGSLFGGRTAGWWRTAPAVLAVSVAALPVVLPGVLGTAVGLALFGVAEVVSPPRPALPPRRHTMADDLDVDSE